MPRFNFRDQRGVVPLLVLVATLGVLLFLAISTLVTFQGSSLFGSLYNNLKKLSFASGSTFYVSPSGDNSTGADWAHAWRNIDQINWSTIAAGSTVYLDGGQTACSSNYDFVSTRPGVNCGVQYTGTMTIGASGTASAPITIRLSSEAGHNGTVVLFGGRTSPLPYCTQTGYSPQYLDSTRHAAGIAIGNNQYIVIDGIKRSGIMIYGYDSGANAQDQDGEGIAFTSGNAAFITVRNAEIFDNGVWFQRGDGSYMSDAPGVKLLGHDLTFERLLVHDNGQDDFQGGSSNADISNMTIRDSWLYMRRSNPSYQGYAFNEGPHTLSQNCQHTDGIQLYRNYNNAGTNLSFDHDIFGPLLVQGVYPSDNNVYYNNTTITNSLFMDALWNNLNVDPQSSTTTPPYANPQNWSVQNSTFYSNPSSVDHGYQTNFGMLSGFGLVMNNSIVNNSGVHLTPNSSTGSGNVFYPNVPTAPSGGAVATGTNLNPGFNTPKNSDGTPVLTPSYDDYLRANFTPGSSCQCLNAGSPIHTIQDILDRIDHLNTVNAPAPLGTPISGGNLITNGDFSSTVISPWVFQVSGEAKAGLTVDSNKNIAGSYAPRITVTKTSSTDYYVQLMQKGLSLTPGASYTLSFYAVANGNRTDNVGIQLDGPTNYTVYFSTGFDVSKTVKKYTYSFTLPPSPTLASGLTYQLAFNFAYNKGIVWIDQVRLTQN